MLIPLVQNSGMEQENHRYRIKKSERQTALPHSLVKGESLYPRLLSQSIPEISFTKEERPVSLLHRHRRLLALRVAASATGEGRTHRGRMTSKN